MGGVRDKNIKFAVETAGIKDPAELANHFKTLTKYKTSGNSSNSERAHYSISQCVMNVEVLIGQDFTEQADVNYIKAGSSLRFFPSKQIHTISHSVVNVGVTENETVQQLVTLLNTYSACIARNMSEVGNISISQMKILLTTEKPIFQRPRRLADAERAEVRKIVDELMKQDTKSKNVIAAIKDLIKTFGVPHRVIADRGTAFSSKEFQQYVTEIGSKLHLTAVAVPRANGQVERYNRTVLNSLATTGATQQDRHWDENLQNIQLGINGTINNAIGVTPSEALMGYRVVTNGLLNSDNQATKDVTTIREQMVEKMEEYQASQKQRFDAARCEGKHYSVGDLILLKITSNAPTGSSQKLLPKWRGPYRITKILGNDRYEVQNIPGLSRSRGTFISVAASENMRPWIQFG
ncbi:hypothetical protein TcasGA2_TC002186 [Tribolium castaneum]|uniref:Integrase catalytic domain-containing protein n=1 Tax=Tribolium castaneum TaxID=7070 RepID=D6WXX1_TRICA|nr:hypothetical protein TcasGA2_TC002186 [Tribolium castaneum]